MKATIRRMRLPKGILFDLDDTIITFDAVADAAWMEVCDRYCLKHGQVLTKMLLDAIVGIRDWYWSDAARSLSGRMDLARARREIVAMAFERLGLRDQAAAFEVADHYSVRRDELIRPIPGATETLARLQQAEVDMVLITNGSAEGQRRKIDRFDLGRFFKAVFIEGEQGIGKPDEKIYRRALDVLGVQPCQAWSVGDNLDWDIAGPQKLGVFGVWNDYQKQGLPVPANVVPDRIVNSIAELL